MRLFVVGNISSGKSYFIDKIKPLLPNYHILKIDEYRKSYCDGSLEKEMQMWNEFPNEIIKHNNVIVELSGGGKVAENIIKLLKDNSFIVIYVDTDSNTCIERSKDKDFKSTPYPEEFKESIEDTINRLGTDFEKQIRTKWAKALKILKVKSSDDPVNLALMQYHELFKLDEVLRNLKGSLFTFGSTGRGEMNISSDVDTYFLCKEDKATIYELLSKEFDSVHLMQDEFVIREKGVLLEMNYIDNIKKAYHFYSTGNITNPYKTILKDDYNIINDLNIASKIEVNKTELLNFTIERLDYYVESLKRLLLKNDEYKYYFHNNIVVHEYVKLRAFLKNVFEYSYLPLNAKSYLSNEEWKKVLYSFGDDMKLHYEVVREMSDEIINEVRIKYNLK